MLGDFSKTRQEYGFSKHYLRNAKYLETLRNIDGIQEI